eukprot:364668-Chlamydomonas_euryale.AAC.10
MEELRAMGIPALGGPADATAVVDFDADEPFVDVDPDVSVMGVEGGGRAWGVKRCGGCCTRPSFPREEGGRGQQVQRAESAGQVLLEGLAWPGGLLGMPMWPGLLGMPMWDLHDLVACWACPCGLAFWAYPCGTCMAWWLAGLAHVA